MNGNYKPSPDELLLVWFLRSWQRGLKLVKISSEMGLFFLRFYSLSINLM